MNPQRSVGSRFADLLLLSAHQAAAGIHDEAFLHRILDQLAPEAAAVLSVFFDDQPRAAVQLRSSGDAPAGSFVMATLIGREAGIPELQVALAYVDHLIALGLLMIGPPVDADSAYRELETGFTLVAAKRDARTHVGATAVHRCSLRLTRLGRALLDAVADT